MRIRWLEKPFTKTIGAGRTIGLRPSNYHGSIHLIGAKVLGFVIDEYYDGTAYEIHLWDYVVYYDRRYTPEKVSA